MPKILPLEIFYIYFSPYTSHAIEIDGVVCPTVEHACAELKIVKHIVTYPPGDGFWDDGDDGNGLNHIGKMWMEIREEIKKSS